MKVIHQHHILIEQIFSLSDLKQCGVTNYRDLKETIKSIDLTVTEQEFDYIVYMCFSRQNVNELVYAPIV